jgi:hypothetical protein
MSQSTPVTAESSPLAFIIIKIVADHIRTIEALTTTSIGTLDYDMLHSSYKDAINLAYALYSRDNLTD